MDRPDRLDRNALDTMIKRLEDAAQMAFLKQHDSDAVLMRDAAILIRRLSPATR